MTNYYKVLGVVNFASTEEIKSAYRKLSKKLHPDVNDGDSFFTEKFKEIQEAYEQLTNSFKRQRYDAELQAYFDYLKYPYRDTPTDFEPEPAPPKKENIKKETPKPPVQNRKPIGSYIFTCLILAAIAFAVYKFISKAITHDDKPAAASQYATNSNSENRTVDSRSATPVQNALIQDTSAAVISPEIVISPVKTKIKLKEKELITTTSSIIPPIEPKTKEIKEKNSKSYFSIGSTKEEVLRVQGNPLSIQDIHRANGMRQVWTFSDNSTVTFYENRVVGFRNIYSPGELKVRMINADKITSNSEDYFTIGSTKEEILKIQGTPLSISEPCAEDDPEAWVYNQGIIKLLNGKLVSYNNSSNQLKVRVIPVDKSNIVLSTYFTIGYTKAEVFKLQGNPVMVSHGKNEQVWIYGDESLVYFSGDNITDRVTQIHDSEGKFKLKKE